MKKLFTMVVLAAFTFTANAQDATATIHANDGKQTICKEIYGQFAEHLGCEHHSQAAHPPQRSHDKSSFPLLRKAAGLIFASLYQQPAGNASRYAK